MGPDLGIGTRYFSKIRGARTVNPVILDILTDAIPT